MTVNTAVIYTIATFIVLSTGLTGMCLEVDFGSVERRDDSLGQSSGGSAGRQRRQDPPGVITL